MPVVWYADGTRPFGEEWASIVDAIENDGGWRTDEVGVTFPSSRISLDRGRTPAGIAGAYRFRVEDTDVDATSDAHRSEIAMGNPTRDDMLDRLFNAGEERWIAFQLWLDDSFPTDPGTWNLVVQFKQLGSFGSPVLSLQVRDGAWRVDRTSHDPTRPTLSPAYHDLGPALTGRWVRLCFHILFSTDPATGFYEVFGDLGDGDGYRQLRTRTTQATLKVSDGSSGARYPAGTTVPSHLRFGIYRSRTITGSTELWLGGTAVATTREEAENRAYGAGGGLVAPSFRSAQNVAYASRRSMAMTWPAGIARGDLLLLQASAATDVSAAMRVSGSWTPLEVASRVLSPVFDSTLGTYGWWWQVYDGSSSAPTVTWGDVARNSAGLIIAIKDPSPTDPLYGWLATKQTNRAPAVTGPTVEAAGTLVGWANFDATGASATVPSGFGLRVADGAESGVTFGDQLVDSTGSVGTLTGSHATSAVRLVSALAVRAAVAGATVAHYDGSRWTDQPLHVYDGSAWRQAAGIGVL